MNDRLDFDAIYLGHTSEIGGGHLETSIDVAVARTQESDGALLLSEEAQKFVRLICLHGMIPSEAYVQAFAKQDEFGNIIKPDTPTYAARMLLRLHEVKVAIEEQRAEIREWCKTEVVEVEMTHRSIMMDPNAKNSDRIAAGKALSALKGYDLQPEGGLNGATINISLPWKPADLSLQPGRTIEHETLDIGVKE